MEGEGRGRHAVLHFSFLFLLLYPPLFLILFVLLLLLLLAINKQSQPRQATGQAKLARMSPNQGPEHLTSANSSLVTLPQLDER